MNQIIINFCTAVLLIIFFIGAGCKKHENEEIDEIQYDDEIKYDDESIVVSSFPDLNIYKTKKNYFNYISVQVTPDGLLNALPGYKLGSSRIKVDDNGNISPNFRWRLKSGFIVDKETSINEVFTDITIQEYVDYNTANGVGVWPISMIEERIIDRDPFTEYYHLAGLFKDEIRFTLGELNTMIENGTIEKHFTKLK